MRDVVLSQKIDLLVKQLHLNGYSVEESLQVKFEFQASMEVNRPATHLLKDNCLRGRSELLDVWCALRVINDCLLVFPVGREPVLGGVHNFC